MAEVASTTSEVVLYCWRHPPMRGAAGRCIGRTDLAVDPRKAKRLAHRVRGHARRLGLPRVVCVSTLQRARLVGSWLRRWGWQVQVDARLVELDFGRWDGQSWADIPWSEVQAWEDDLLHHAPGGGECLAQLLQRVQAFVDECGAQARVLVTHGGWITTLLQAYHLAARPAAAHWPRAPRHGSLTVWRAPLVG
jgi:alpha-ribazole phosphatase